MLESFANVSSEAFSSKSISKETFYAGVSINQTYY